MNHMYSIHDKWLWLNEIGNSNFVFLLSVVLIFRAFFFIPVSNSVGEECESGKNTVKQTTKKKKNAVIQAEAFNREKTQKKKLRVWNQCKGAYS